MLYNDLTFTHNSHVHTPIVAAAMRGAAHHIGSNFSVKCLAQGHNYGLGRSGIGTTNPSDSE